MLRLSILVFLVLACAMRAEDVPAAATEASAEDRKKSRELFEEGLAIEKKKDLPGAIEKWEAALKADPANSPCLNHYAWFLGVSAPAELLDTAKAVGLAQRAATATQSRNKDILDTLAEIHFQRKEYAQAVEAQKKAVAPGLDGHCDAKYLQKQLEKFEQALAGNKAK